MAEPIIVDGLTRAMLEVLRRLYASGERLRLWHGGHWTNEVRQPTSKPKPGWWAGTILVRSLASKGYLTKVRIGEVFEYELTAKVQAAVPGLFEKAGALASVVAHIKSVGDDAFAAYSPADLEIARSSSLPHLRAWIHAQRGTIDQARSLEAITNAPTPTEDTDGL